MPFFNSAPILIRSSLQSCQCYWRAIAVSLCRVSSINREWSVSANRITKLHRLLWLLKLYALICVPFVCWNQQGIRVFCTISLDRWNKIISLMGLFTITTVESNNLCWSQLTMLATEICSWRSWPPTHRVMLDALLMLAMSHRSVCSKKEL